MTALPSSTVSEMDEDILKKVIQKVHLLTGITISEQKKTMIQSRMRRRMRDLQIVHYTEYMDYLNKTPDETQNFINVMTTNETSFFRTPRIWTYFQKEFLPEWYKNNPKTTLKVWSAAASSGEEAYSMAIACTEFKLLHPDFDFKILATDISTAVLEEAKQGHFVERSVEFLKKSHPDLFKKHFTTKSPEIYAINSDLKQRIQFETHNLFKVKKEQFDIIFLRNVLIYFIGPDQEIVLSNVGKSLKPTGVLIIGESESLSRLQTPYEFKAACIYTLLDKGVK